MKKECAECDFVFPSRKFSTEIPYICTQCYENLMEKIKELEKNEETNRKREL